MAEDGEIDGLSCVGVLSWFQYYPVEEVLAAEYLLEEFRPDLIEMVLDKLRPEHVRSVTFLFYFVNSL